MRICFIDPEGIHFGLNAGLGYIVSYLKNIHGYKSIKVLDFNNKKIDIASRLEEIRTYDVVGISIQSYTLQFVSKIAHKIKTKENLVIAGGPHITLDGAYFLETNERFDVGVSGEGEITLANLLRVIEQKGDFESIKGLYYRKGKRVIFTGEPERIRDLDALPYPAYSVFDSISNGKIHNYPLVTSRGCPYQCTYCCVGNTTGKKWFARSVTNIINELHEARKQYKIDCFNIQDDNFSLNMQRAKSLCTELIEKNLNLKWSCHNGIRADKIDDELMKKMNQSGCYEVSIGIESPVKKEFETIKKGENFSDIINAITTANSNQISVCGNFIIGLPYSTLNSVRTSIRFAIDLKLASCIFNLLVPFPKTELWDWVQSHAVMLRDWREGFTIGRRPIVVFETYEFSIQDRIRAYYEANIKCKNYFAFLNEHDPVTINIFYVLKTILKYDFIRLPSHIFFWCINIMRIFKRVAKKI